MATSTQAKINNYLNDAASSLRKGSGLLALKKSPVARLGPALGRTLRTELLEQILECCLIVHTEIEAPTQGVVFSQLFRLLVRTRIRGFNVAALNGYHKNNIFPFLCLTMG
jgi:hypothetical protein